MEGREAWGVGGGGERRRGEGMVRRGEEGRRRREGMVRRGEDGESVCSLCIEPPPVISSLPWPHPVPQEREGVW